MARAMLGRLFKKTAVQRPLDTARVPAGMRIYAIGDIHGRNDLLQALLAKIEADDAERGAADTHIIFLGDLMDRGPDSAGVVDTAMALTRRGPQSPLPYGQPRRSVRSGLPQKRQ